MGQIRQVIPLSEFTKNLDEYVGILGSVAEPIMITRRGRALFVVQSPDSFAESSDFADHARYQMWAKKEAEDETPP